MTPPRVVSLVPSATESLRAWAVEPVAVTRFCPPPHPRAVGGTKDPDIEAIVALRPDLVVMCIEENRREDADALTARGIEIVALSIDTVTDVVTEWPAWPRPSGSTRRRSSCRLPCLRHSEGDGPSCPSGAARG